MYSVIRTEMGVEVRNQRNEAVYSALNTEIIVWYGPRGYGPGGDAQVFCQHVGDLNDTALVLAVSSAKLIESYDQRMNSKFLGTLTFDKLLKQHSYTVVEIVEELLRQTEKES